MTNPPKWMDDAFVAYMRSTYRATYIYEHLEAAIAAADASRGIKHQFGVKNVHGFWWWYDSAEERRDAMRSATLLNSYCETTERWTSE